MRAGSAIYICVTCFFICKIRIIMILIIVVMSIKRTNNRKLPRMSKYWVSVNY